MHWRSDAHTDPGAVRSNNEDAVLERAGSGIWAVADGMGGHSRGEVASAMVVDALQALPAPDPLADVVDQMEDALAEADARIRELTGESGATMGATVAALVGRGEWAVCLWAGDSRIYRLRDDTLFLLTEDHAYVQDLVRAGLLSEEEARHHPQANVITRAVGAGPELLLDAELADARAGDRFLLCSDGLVRDTDTTTLAATLAGDFEGVARRLVAQALAGGAQDNVTAVVVEVDDASR